MMRLVVVLALVAVALAQDDDGSYNAERYENPYAYSEQQASAPAVPQYQPQVPQYQPQVPQYQPQVPQYQPQVPQYQPQVPQYQPQVPQYQPQVPQYRPAAPQVPQYQPQVPQYQPQYQAAAAPSVNALQTSTNYKTQDHERFENVDGQGNVRGQYSYVDPNGKTITVKYTAGKDGFQVEGDHLPRVPVPGAAPAPTAHAAVAAAPAATAAYQPRYFQPSQPAQPAPVYESRYQPAAPAYQPHLQPQSQVPSAVAQFLNAPLGHRFAAASGAPAAPGAPSYF